LSQAEELKGRGQVAEACKHLEEVERLDPKLPTVIELAECSEQIGKLVEAQGQWALARDRAKHDEKPQSRARAEQRLAALEKRLAHLTLQLAANAAGAQVLRDDVPLDPALLAGALTTNPGDHVIVVRLAGHDDAKYAVKLADGDNQTLPIAAGPATGSQALLANSEPLLPQGVAHSLRQIGTPDWLEDEIGGSGALEAQPRGVIASAADDDDWNVPGGGIAFHLAGDFPPAQAWQTQVQQHEIRRLRRDAGECLFSAAGNLSREAFPLEHDLQDLAIVGSIIDDQNPRRGRAGVGAAAHVPPSCVATVAKISR
jgi:hypothetical protein